MRLFAARIGAARIGTLIWAGPGHEAGPRRTAMIVMKFGGTSVKDAESIRRVTEIVRERLPLDPAVVVSAHSGVTDLLIKAAQGALKGEVAPRTIILTHQKIIKDLGLPQDLVAAELSGLNELLRGIALVGELSPRSLDLAMSFGERMSSKVLAAHFNNAGIPAAQYNSYEIGFETDSNFQGAIIQKESLKTIGRFMKSVPEGKMPVVTGFLGHDKSGNITTIGRSGSDLTATYLGAAVGATEVQIWKDVFGIMTADPTVVPEAKSIASMSFEEAAELAYYGAQVLHPATITPAIEANIPVRVLNTFEPNHPGTVIVGTSSPSPEIVKSIVYKEDLNLVTIASTRMLMQPGFMYSIFRIFKKWGISVDMVATSEVTVSLTVDSTKHLEEAVAELGEIAEVTVEKDKTLVAVVGYGIREARGLAAKVFASVAETGVNVQMISQGARMINLSFLVDNTDIVPVVRALHKAFFGDQGKARKPVSGRQAAKSR